MSQGYPNNNLPKPNYNGKLTSNGNVSITDGEKKMSAANKAKKPRSFRQLPVVRDASNLAYMIAQVEIKCPVKCRCLVDELERLTTNLLQILDMCNEHIINRAELCTEAHSCIMTIAIKLDILQKLAAVDNDTKRKTKQLCDAVIRQIVGWRSSVQSNQGPVSKV